MSRRPKLYIVCYDICGDGAPKRLRKVYLTLRAYGDHLQFSVFRCRLTELQLERLCSQLEQQIHHRRDQVLFVPLGNADTPTSWQPFTLGQSLSGPERVVRII
jgi:CRISPR-associated protein Cas2